MKESLFLYCYYVKNTIKAWFQYKIDAFLRSFAVFLREAANIIIIYLALSSFKDLNGWNADELFFLYSFVFLTYSFLIILFTGLRDFEKLVRKGDLDRFLLRPRGVLFQVLASNSDWFAAIGHGTLGIILFISTAGKIGIDWNFINILYCLFSVISGVLIQGAIFLFIASLSFYLIKVGNIRNLLYYDLRQFAGYPVSIFHKLIQILMVYVVPFAFVNFFPAQFYLRKNDLALFPSFYIYLAPFAGLILYFLAYLFWRISIRHYHSTGN